MKLICFRKGRFKHHEKLKIGKSYDENEWVGFYSPGLFMSREDYRNKKINDILD